MAISCSFVQLQFCFTLAPKRLTLTGCCILVEGMLLQYHIGLFGEQPVGLLSFGSEDGGMDDLLFFAEIVAFEDGLYGIGTIKSFAVLPPAHSPFLDIILTV